MKKKAKKKVNDKSRNIRDWSLRKVKSQAKLYEDICHGVNACYGCRDLLMLGMLMSELERRGVGTEVVFN